MTFLTTSSYTTFVTISLFTALLSLLKLAGILSNLAMSNLSKFYFKLVKLAFLAKLDVSLLVAFSKSNFVPYLGRSSSNFISVLLRVYCSQKYFILYNNLCFIDPTIKLIITSFPFDI